MGKVAVCIDGYNVYKSIKRWKLQSGESLLWIDYWKLSQRLVEQQPLTRFDDKLVAVNYYTALTEDNPQKKTRHREYINALDICAKGAGGIINTVYGKFQVIPNGRQCTNCGYTWNASTEKKSDTALCSQIVDDAHRGVNDCVIVITSDSDMAPAMATIKDQPGFEHLRVVLAYPPRTRRGTSNRDLNLASHCQMKTTSIMRQCQMPDPVVLPGGKPLRCPPRWQ